MNEGELKEDGYVRLLREASSIHSHKTRHYVRASSLVF